MKKTLIEELQRIHSLTYNKNTLNEGLLDDLTKKIKQYVSSRKVDEPTKADYISEDIKEFYSTLESIDLPLTQQKYGSMVYQKKVEAVQIGLMLLGYDLPKHGVDGLFGPETAVAVNKYKSDKNIQDTPQDDITKTFATDLNEAAMMEPIPIPDKIDHGFDEKRGNRNHGGIDIPAKVGTPIKSIADGQVIAAGPLDSKCGDGISISHADGFLSSYCHLSGIKVRKGEVIKQGQIIGLTGGAKGAQGSGNSGGPHLHLTLKKDGQRVDPLQFLGKSIGSYDSQTYISDFSGNAVVTVNMVKELISDLKSRNITSDDLKQLIDTSKTLSSLEGLSANDFDKMMNVIIEKLEGGYYHPDMLSDGRIKDKRFGNSGETLFGIDRKAGNWESRSSKGREFFAILDSVNARKNWNYNYMGGSYRPQLQKLATEMIKDDYISNSKKYLSKESQSIVNSNPKLTFNFIYATYNGPGWFQRFAKLINQLVESGTTDPDTLSKSLIDRRKYSENSLIAQTGRKIEKIVGSDMA